MADHQRTRRRFLGALAVPLAGGVAGCQVNASLGSSSTPTESRQPYDALRHERLYVAESLSLSSPEGVYVASSPEEADVILLPATTDRDHATIVGWLQADRRVAFLGARSEDAYHDLRESSAYAEAFGPPQGRAESCAGSGTNAPSGDGDDDCESPELVVAWKRDETMVTRYSRTWAHTDDPSDAEVFEGLDAGVGARR